MYLPLQVLFSQQLTATLSVHPCDGKCKELDWYTSVLRSIACYVAYLYAFYVTINRSLHIKYRLIH